MQANLFPVDAIAAVMHPDPYPYYAKLVAHTPLYRDEALGLWIASSTAAVTAALTSDLCRVRPVNEPVPTALLSSPAADVFRQLIRMNDGGGHCPFNRAIAATLTSIEPARIAERSAQVASGLLREFESKDLAQVTEVAFKLAPHVIGGLLGIPEERLDQTSRWVGDFVRCVFPSSTPEQVERGKAAAGNLLGLFNGLFSAGGREGTNGLLMTLAREAERVGRADHTTIVANGIGFLSQAYEATAGLISNALLALATRAELRHEISDDPSLVRELILEVLRYDPPSHNTRRFLATDGAVLGRQMKSGDAILVVVAAANRDPEINPEPDRFDIHRKQRRLFTFGAGVHACPGEAIALTIAQAGVSAFLKSGLKVERLQDSFTYRASANTHIPLFANTRDGNARPVG